MRILVLFLVLTCFLAWMLPTNSSAEIDPETAVGVWLFDEGRGTTVADISGKGNDGEIVGAKWADGKFGDGLEFEGAQMVTVDSTIDLQLGEKHTMMAWFYATNIDSWRQLIAKDGEYLLRIDPPGEGNNMSSFVFIGGWEPRASAGVPLEETWTHFAATYDNDKNADQLVVYVNGERTGSSTRGGNGIGNDNAVTFGSWGNGSYFIGIIDEVAIFKAVLTEDDLKTIIDNGLDEALGGAAAVDASNKLTTTWADLKSQ